MEAALALIHSQLQETSQILGSLEALGRSHCGAQLKAAWQRFFGGGNVLRIPVNHEGCSVWQGKRVNRKLLYLLEMNLTLLKLSWGFVCLVKFKLKINYGRALNLLSGCLDANSETPVTSLSAKCDSAKAVFSLFPLMCNYSIFYCIMKRRVLIIEPD